MIVTSGKPHHRAAPPTTAPAPPQTTAPPTTTAPPPPPPPPPTRPMSWQAAGAFVWHPENIDPALLGQEMRANGFGWVAIRIHDGLNADRIDPTWIPRFLNASGLPVGGWGVLRDRPEQEAQLASSLIAQYGLDFYIADAEAEYKYTGSDGQSPKRLGRSARFVQAFRALRPALPAGLSSYCWPDTQDIDWPAWRKAGFVFLPQAYVNQVGPAAAPAACVRGAASFFPSEDVHPTVGTFPAEGAAPSPEQYAQMLRQAGTVGFSLYLAEVNMPDPSWRAYGAAIAHLGIAK